MAVSRVRALFPMGDHVEICKGDEASNIAYCTKDDSRILGPFRIGEPSKPGKRSDIVAVREMIAAGKGMGEIVLNASSFQAMKCAELCLKYMEIKRTWKTEVRWYHGSTGSGKTRDAFREFPDAWVSLSKSTFMEGYDAHMASSRVTANK